MIQSERSFLFFGLLRRTPGQGGTHAHTREHAHEDDALLNILYMHKIQFCIIKL